MTSIRFPQAYSTGLLVYQRIEILEDYKETKNIPSWKELKRTHRWGFLIPPKKLGMADWIYVRNDVFQIYKESGMKKNEDRCDLLSLVKECIDVEILNSFLC